MRVSPSRRPDWFSYSGEGFLNLAYIPPEVSKGSKPGPALDPGTRQVIGGAFFAVCREMDLTLRNSSLSPIVNNVFPTTASIIVCSLLSLTDPTIMPNHGFYRPIYVKVPRGTLLNPEFPAPVVGFPDVCNRVFDVIMESLTPVLPKKIIASTSGTTTNCFFGGTHPATGKPYVWYSINSQGGWSGEVDRMGNLILSPKEAD